MDKQLPNLDPKLKEIYERVMGTNISPSAPPPSLPQQQTPLQPAIPKPTITPPQALISNTPPTTTTVAKSVDTKQKPAVTTFVAKRSGANQKLFPVLYGIGGVIFLIVYTIFWMRVFGVPVPYFE